MNLSDIIIIFVVVGLLPLLFLTGETNLFNNNSYNSVNIGNQFAYAQQDEYENGENDIDELLSSILKFNSNSDDGNQQQDSQQQDSQQQDSQQQDSQQQDSQQQDSQQQDSQQQDSQQQDSQQQDSQQQDSQQQDSQQQDSQQQDSQQQDSQQQDSQQQDSQQAKITVVETDDSTCETPLYEKVKLDGTIIEPEEKLLIADFTPCKISDGKVTFDIPINSKLQLGIPYTDFTDNKYGHVNDNSLSIKTALLSPTEVHNAKDTGLFAIELHDGEKWKDKSTGEKTTFTNINELYLYNSGDEPLNFKSGDIAVIRATLDK